MASQDTIAAIATPPGTGGVGIVRVSGPGAALVAQAMLGRVPPARTAVHGRFREADGSALDDGLALYFPGPRSFTGEDVLELHGHGGPVVLDLILRRVLALGARPARPGEFSERAFLNGKLDLAQAEAVADLIASGSEQAARAALRSLEGAFSERVRFLSEQAVELRVYVEAAIDFPDEEVDFLSEGDVAARLAALRDALAEVLATARQGRALRDGLTLVLAGAPNAGKSSLMNRLVGAESAIVTEVPGTTRDVLREAIHLDGLPLHVIDTAGLREGADPVEAEGVRRAWREIERADRVLLVIDDARGEADPAVAAIGARLPPAVPVTRIHNKIDLTGRVPGPADAAAIAVSARTGAGLDALREHLKALAGYHSDAAGALSARRRHLDALAQADAALERAQAQLAGAAAGELVAEELREVQRALGEITGEVTTEDLLGRIFSSFCIGK